MMLRTAPPLLPLVLLLAGCTPVDTGFGEAVRWDVAQQVINPDPVQHGALMEGGSGVRAEAAVERYEKGEVKVPVPLQTTTGGTTGSGPK